MAMTKPTSDQVTFVNSIVVPQSLTVDGTTLVVDSTNVSSSWELARSTANQAAVYERSSSTERTAASFRISTTAANAAAYTDFNGVYLAVFR